MEHSTLFTKGTVEMNEKAAVQQFPLQSELMKEAAVQYNHPYQKVKDQHRPYQSELPSRLLDQLQEEVKDQ